MTRRQRRSHPPPRLRSQRHLDALIEQTIADAYGTAEQGVGFHAMLEQMPVIEGIELSVCRQDELRVD